MTQNLTRPQAQFSYIGIDAHKRQAHLLRAYLAHHGVPVQHNHALEAVAALHGLEHWRILSNRPTSVPLHGEAAERALLRRLTALGHPLNVPLVQGVAALLLNPAILLFDPKAVAFFYLSPAELNARDLTVQFSETEAMQVWGEDAWSLMGEAAIENTRAVHHLKVPALGLFNEGVPVIPPGAIMYLPSRNRVYRHSSGLFVSRAAVLSPWPLLPMPDRVGEDVMKRLEEGHTLTWTKGGSVHLDGTELLGDLGEPVPEWVDTDGSQLEAWWTQLELALPGTSHYVVTHSAGGVVRVMMRRGVAEMMGTQPMESPVMVLDDQDPMMQAFVVALARREAEIRPVTVAAHPALIGSVGPTLFQGARVVSHDSQTLAREAAALLPHALLVLYLDSPVAEQAALTAASRGVHILAVALHRQEKWEGELRAAWQENHSDSKIRHV